MKKHAIIAAMMALVAMAVVPSMASAITLTAKGVALGAGAPVTAFSPNLVFTGNNGLQLKCAENDLVGSVEKNAPSPTLKITAATFKAAGGGENCLTNVAGITADVTPVASSFPWVVHFEASDKFSITDPVFTATITMPSGTSIGHCTFTSAKVEGTFTTNPAEAQLTVTSGNFVKIAPSDAGCTATAGTLTGSTTIFRSGANGITIDP